MKVPGLQIYEGICNQGAAIWTIRKHCPCVVEKASA